MAEERAAVVVVGAGPVGLVAAIELARRGLRPVVLDAKPGIAWSSRAICISRRSQEILDRIGAGPAFAAKALPWSRGRTFHRDRLVFRLELPHAPDDRHAPFINLQQFHTERFLLDTFEAAGGGVRWNERLAGVEQEADGVALTLAGPEGERTLRAEWVVAADGGRSALRELMGLSLRGTSYEGRYLIADVEVEGADWPVERHVWFDPPSNPGSTVILHVQPDGVWRVDIQLRDGEDAEEALRDENASARLRAQLAAMGVRAPWRLLWKAVYRAHCLTLDGYRHGRVLFAGDAAHLVPIFGVRGLNSGIDDAHNLGWKLAMVARGEAPEALLDSYSHERKGAALENIAQAAKSTWFMSPPGPGFRLMRDAALALAAEHPWASALADPRQASAHTYADSPAVVPDGDATAGVPPGAPVPNAPAVLVEPGRGARPGHLHDALPDKGFTLLVFVDPLGPERAADLLAAPALTGLPLEAVLVGSERGLAAVPTAARRVADAGGALAERFAARAFPLCLVRPDEHVAARFRDADAAAVAEAFGAALCRHSTEARTAPPPPPLPDARAGALGREGLERVFEAVGRGAGAARGGADADFLARLALLLAVEVGDPERVLALVAAASPEPAAGG
ncbi:FAD-dependent monooxygenase [Craurococcus roseus]|uniref:FAD-dependent monooxygenase n=1 Tax=Craurococcus roseus TaxID=77585 RepID=UPI0031DDBB54